LSKGLILVSSSELNVFSPYLDCYHNKEQLSSGCGRYSTLNETRDTISCALFVVISGIFAKINKSTNKNIAIKYIYILLAI